MTVVRTRQKRGHIRMNTLLDAAAEVFAERGYDGATMTEIAVRAASSIGSLYQFYPTKELMSDALIARYLDHVEGYFEAIREGSAGWKTHELVDRLVTFSTLMASQYPFIVKLLSNDTRRSHHTLHRMRERMRDIMLERSSTLTAERAWVMGEAVLLMLRVISEIPEMIERRPDDGMQANATAELKIALYRYLDGELHDRPGEAR